MCVYSRWFAGKVGAISDSSPPDDGTGDVNDVLYNGYTLDAAGNHQRLIMNMTIWLALGGPATSGVEELKNENGFILYPNPANTQFTLSFVKPLQNAKIEITNVNGSLVSVLESLSEKETALNTSELNNGVYFVRINSENNSSTVKLVVIH